MPLDHLLSVESLPDGASALARVGQHVCGHRNVDRCLVTVHADRNGRTFTVVHYVRRSDGDPIDLELSLLLRKALSPAEVPALLIDVNRIPPQLLGHGLFVRRDDSYMVGKPTVDMAAAQTASENQCKGDLREAQPEPGVVDPSVTAAGNGFAAGPGSDPMPLLCLRDGDGAPILMLAGHELYRQVAERLPEGRPVFGISLRWRIAVLDASLSERDILQVINIRVIVDEHIAVIRQAKFEGDLTLAGASMGGLLALEVGRELVRQGEPVALVAMMDTFPPNFSELLSPVDKLHGHLISLVRHGIRPLITKAVRRVTRALHKLPKKGGSDHGAGHCVILKTNDICLLSCEMRRYDGQVVLVLPKCRAPFAPTVEDYGWGNYIPRLAVRYAPGEHISMLRVGAEQIAEEISAFL